MRFEKQVKSYELRYVTCKIPLAPADDSTVQNLDRSSVADPNPYLDPKGSELF